MQALTSPSDSRKQRNDKGIALVIVLAFVVLLTGLVVAYFARTLTDRQLSNSSFNQAAADQLANSALALITSDLKQEIVNSSSATTIGNVTIYTSTSNVNAVPVRNGVPTSWGTPWSTNNTTLLRESTGTAIQSPGVDQLASNALSTGTSANGKTVSMVRWNQHYLIPLANSAAPTNATPSSNFTAPSWVYVTGSGGPVVLTSPTNTVVGRYAYAVYDEGALLDVNVAGFPCDPSVYGTQPTYNGTMPPQYQPKGGSAYADLTAFFPSGALASTQNGVNNLIGWRNYASLSNNGSPIATGNFPQLKISGTNVLNAYKSLVASNTNGFLSVSGSTANGSTDQACLTRQQLINLILASGSANFNPNALQYLGTFSRAVSAPSWSPPADSPAIPGYVGGGTSSSILYKSNAEQSTISSGHNPNRDMANVRFAQSGIVTHWSDGAISGSGTMINPKIPLASGTYTVNAGDPLLQSRFSLAKIAWLSQADPNSGNFVDPTGTYTTAIQACFGLTWGIPKGGAANGGNPCWSYVGSPAGTGGTLHPFNGTIETLDVVAEENREPNFFELLKAAILNGSVGVSPGISCFLNGTVAPYSRGNWSPGSFRDSYTYSFSGVANTEPGDDNLYSYSFDRKFYPYATPPTTPLWPAPAGIGDMQIMQIGANIIDQYDADSYPTAIYFNYKGMTSNNDAAVPGNQIFGSSDMVFGDENLPYLQGFVNIFATTDGGPVTVPADEGYDQKTHPLTCWWQPLIWNPHQMPNPANTGFAPPQSFQINGYTASTGTSGGLKFYWSNPQYTGSAPTPPQAQRSNTSNPEQIDNGGVPVQYITFNDSAPTSSAFYAAPLLLASSGIPSVSANGNLPQMMASTYPKIVHESQNQFVGFWGGTDPNYMGGWPAFINTEAEVSGAVTFCLGWTGTNGKFHPYSYIPGIFAISNYGVIDNGPRDGTANQGGALPADSTTSDYVLADALTTRFGPAGSYSVGSSSAGSGVQSVNTYFGNSYIRYSYSGPTGGSGQPYSPNFDYPNGNIPNGDSYDCDWEVNSPTPLAIGGSGWTPSLTYYIDPDGVARPGDGVFGNITTADGMQLYTSTVVNGVAGVGKTTSGYTPASGDTASSGPGGGVSQHGRRQVILNRPFRSVGELSYTYRDLPFKTLDFFSTSSADAALLDVFSVTDEARVSNGQLNSVVAGQVNLSDAPYRVIASLLAGDSKKDFDPSYYISNNASKPITNPTTASKLAQGIFAALSPLPGVSAPLTNRADLVTRLGAAASTGTGVLLNAIAPTFPGAPSPDVSNKSYLEAPVRALADVANTRTWNLMIDVIAQTGNFNAPTGDLNGSFVVQGERRYWLHVAIDRFTGKVVAQQLEPVYE